MLYYSYKFVKKHLLPPEVCVIYEPHIDLNAVGITRRERET